MLFLGYAAATALYVALIAMAGGAIRGTDQWWYAQEAQTVLDGGPKIGNEVYPYPFLQNHRVDNPFMHHTLGLYCMAAAGKFLGVVRGWQCGLALSIMVGGACVAWLVHHLTRQPLAAWVAYAFYLLNPLTIWQGGNLLMEPFYGMWMALAALQYVTAGRDKARWMLLLASLVLAVQCRPIFLPLLLGLPWVFLLHEGKPLQGRNVLFSMGCFGVGCLAVAMNGLLFESSLPPTVADNIRCCGPGKGSMDYYFVLDPPAVGAGFICEKALAAMKMQFLCLDAATAPLFWLYNACVAGSLVLLAGSARNARARRELRLAGFACAVFAIHLAFISLHRAQFRVAMTFLAPQVACVAVAAARCKQSMRRILAVAMVAVMIAFLLIDLRAVHKLREDGVASMSEQAALRENLAAIPLHDRIIYESVSDANYMPVTYATHPRRTLLVTRRQRYSDDVYQRLQREFEAQWLICPEGSPLATVLSARKVQMKTALRGSMLGLCFYRLPGGDDAVSGGGGGR